MLSQLPPSQQQESPALPQETFKMQLGSPDGANNVTMACRSAGEQSDAFGRRDGGELQEVAEKLQGLNQSGVKSKTTVVRLQKSLSKLHAEVEWSMKAVSPRLTKNQFSKSQDLQQIGEIFNEEDSLCQLARMQQNLTVDHIEHQQSELIVDQLRLSLRKSKSALEIAVVVQTATQNQLQLASQNQLQDNTSKKLPSPIVPESKKNLTSKDFKIGQKTQFSSKFGKENKPNICKLCRQQIHSYERMFKARSETSAKTPVHHRCYVETIKSKK